jgi:hypothetical protein
MCQKKEEKNLECAAAPYFGMPSLLLSFLKSLFFHRSLVVLKKKKKEEEEKSKVS